MFRLHVIPYGTKFDIVGKSKYLLSLAIVLILVCIGCIIGKGLNYGIDFQGGYIFDVKMPTVTDVPNLRNKLGGLNLGEVAIQQFGAPNELSIKLEKTENKEQSVAIKEIKKALGDGVIYKKI
jgi:preprotein translocase subunit SecF